MYGVAVPVCAVRGTGHVRQVRVGAGAAAAARGGRARNAAALAHLQPEARDRCRYAHHTVLR